ncbi:NfeD family protein [Fontivita pretiosa]|uniref:NfeD family protein n=1 Tax=Fontivita pretiosa TaxID=2989684 RepID=UPI003D16F45B
MTRTVGLIMLGFLLAAVSAAAAAQAPVVCTIRINSPIGPATASYIARAIDEAAARDAQCLIIELDTPGGLLDSTRQIVQSLLASPVPVVVYVSPHGATATSAGCFITLAADVAAMAPATTIGAAHPVTLDGSDESPPARSDQPATQPAGGSIMRQKLENFAVSYIESIAARRHRNVEWARSAVRDSASITAEKALELGVIEIIAQDRADLLRQLDGRSVGNRTLATANASIVPIPQTVREKVFQTLWRPEVMFLLMLIAMYGIIGELSNPGAIFPGVVGVIALVLMLYMAAILPVNIAGLALIGLALALFIFDIFAPTHGVLTAGGIIAFFLGALMMFDRTEPMLRISLALIVPATVLTALFFIFVVGAGLRAQWLPRAVGAETLIGRTVIATTPIGPQAGKVFIEGEYWNAVSDEPIPANTPVRIIARNGLTLVVRRADST